MKEFLKYTLASIIGFFISFFLIFGIMFLIVFSITMASFQEPEVTIDDGSILHVKLNSPIQERVSDNPLENFDFRSGRIKRELSLKQIIDNIERAKEDDKIEGIFLDLSVTPSNFSYLQEVRGALEDFKESDKFIYAYADRFLQTPYYIASAADSIFMHPNQAEFGLRGFHMESAYFRGSLDKLDIEPVVFRAGNYKTAGETFERYSMSEENREQMSSILNNTYDNFLEDIGDSRGIETDSIRYWADNLEVITQDDALERDFIDDLIYRDELNELLAEAGGKEEGEDPNKVSLLRYHQVEGKSPRQQRAIGAEDQIALIYGLGPIVDGEGEREQISARGFSSNIREAREDDNVEAIVLRVNSPGGSALASDVIWREVNLASEEKPVVVSMGNVAASGGYYIAAPADKIYASSTSVTGSIGVIAMLPYLENFWQNKLGINFDRVKTGEYADFGNPNRRLTPTERDRFNQIIQRYYDEFIERVAEGRDMDPETVDSLGRGRVYSGEGAYQAGLIDGVGGFYDAIEDAAELAEIEEYSLKVLPRRKNPIERLLEDMGRFDQKEMVKESIKEEFEAFEHLKLLHDSQDPMAIMPFSLELKEARF